MFKFEYAIVSPNGYYYTGEAGKDSLSPNRHKAYTYTEEGAYTKIRDCLTFKDFLVERVI